MAMDDWAKNNMGATFYDVIEEGKSRARNYRKPSLIKAAYCILSDIQEEVSRLGLPSNDAARKERIRHMCNKAKFWLDSAEVYDKELAKESIPE
jgi:hypothetical protein